MLLGTVNPEAVYAKFKWAGELYIAAKTSCINFQGNYRRISGKDLVGRAYKPPFDYYIKDTTLKNHKKRMENVCGGFRNF